LLVGLAAPLQAFTQRRHQGPRVIVAGGSIGPGHDGTKVAKSEVVDVGSSGVGPVAPLGGPEEGNETLSHGDESVGADFGIARCSRPGVLFGEGLANRSHATAEHLLGDRPLFRRQAAKRFIAVLAAGLELLGAGPRGA
jgi:hypothetical protein